MKSAGAFRNDICINGTGMIMRRTIINRIVVLTRWKNRIRSWIRRAGKN